MKVIICGAGQVGTNIASYLAGEDNDVTVIDKDPAKIAQINDTLDANGILGFASQPDVLDRAGARDAEMIIAATHIDEVNMVSCQVAHSIFNVPKKIARVRNQSYLEPVWANLFSREHMPIDVIISPELEVARAISERLLVPGAFNIIPLAEGLVQLVGVLLNEDCPLIHTPLKHLTTLFPDLIVEVVAIMRDDKLIIPQSEEQMFPGDQVYFVTATRHLRRSMAAFGHEEPEARRLIIIGGGNIGLCLAQNIEHDHPDVSVRLIEANPDRANFISQHLQKTIVLSGDGLDRGILEEANVAQTETVVAVTDDDEGNILGSLLAKRYGCERAITLINKSMYSPLVTNIGIDAVANPRAITVSSILQYIRRGRVRAVHSLGEGMAEVMEAEALDTSKIINTPLNEVQLPHDVIVGAIVRGDEVICPRPDSVIKPHDRVVIAAAPGQTKKVEKLFAVRLEFF